jgi:hypothetical protein
VVVLVLLAALTGVTTTAATGSLGSDDFRAGRVYRGDFPDPDLDPQD